MECAVAQVRYIHQRRSTGMRSSQWPRSSICAEKTHLGLSAPFTGMFHIMTILRILLFRHNSIMRRRIGGIFPADGREEEAEFVWVRRHIGRSGSSDGPRVIGLFC